MESVFALAIGLSVGRNRLVDYACLFYLIQGLTLSGRNDYFFVQRNRQSIATAAAELRVNTLHDRATGVATHDDQNMARMVVNVSGIRILRCNSKILRI